ncbi:DNA replication regulator SLD3-domain-containing protein [Xylariaceae sp. FL0255]|nr:DNA replication regulator SLD3-domain-containing protein [Xylariaceae sp. FL0255]
MEHLLKPLIVIKPHPPRLTIQPRTLQPLMLLPREHLPLSFLDLSSPYGNFEPSAFFESNIRILHLEGRMGDRPVVLIARLESNKSVYAIERQENSLYNLCRLGSWVDLETLSGLATVACPQLICKRTDPPLEQTAPRPTTTPQISHNHKKRRLAIEAIQSLVKKPKRSLSVSVPSQSQEAAQRPVPAPEVSGSFVRNDGHESDAPPVTGSGETLSKEPVEATISGQDRILNAPNADGIFDDIRSQYSTALYHSKGSLAYFAKGPLSRARAAFHFDCDSTLETGDLLEFLKSLVMTTVQIDKKYRETIPEIRLKMKTNFDDTDPEQAEGKTKNRKRKPKKIKLGKDGLYPDEDNHVKQWWTENKSLIRDDEGTTTKSNEQQDVKLLASRLRSRETQLQMIIILEILALEPLLAHETQNVSQLPGQLPPEESSGPKDAPPKKRNKHNLPFLLDVHADRLCIWQSTALDEVGMGMFDDSQTSSKVDAQKSSRSTSDPLKDFCVDIVMPFFSSRLPDRCDSINRKLGGPVFMSPPKSNEKKPREVLKVKSKPGTATKRPAPPRSSRTLERVLSKETERNRRSMSRGPSGAIALMRSASTSTVPLLKREASEPVSLISIPRPASSASQEQKGALARLAAPKRKTTEDKEKRDALVQAELRDAISTLRRPNRDVVGKAMAEADERRASTSLSQLRKSRKPTQHPRFQNIVKATPVGTRFYDVLASNKQSRPAPLSRPGTIPEEYAAPSSSMVPSSAPRKRNQQAAFASEQPSHPKLQVTNAERHVTATPARPSNSSHHLLSVPEPDEGIVLVSSPLIARKIAQPQLFAGAKTASLDHRDSGIGLLSSPNGPTPLTKTPVKRRHDNSPVASNDQYVTVTPAKMRILNSRDIVPVHDDIENQKSDLHQEKENGRTLTIYERLGWDDDFDDLA